MRVSQYGVCEVRVSIPVRAGFKLGQALMAKAYSKSLVIGMLEFKDQAVVLCLVFRQARHYSRMLLNPDIFDEPTTGMDTDDRVILWCASVRITIKVSVLTRVHDLKRLTVAGSEYSFDSRPKYTWR